MAREMYQSMLGWSEYKKGDEKHTPTHFLLEKKEYEEVGMIQDQIQDLKRQLLRKDKECDLAVHRKENEMNTIINQKEIAFRTKIEELEEKVQDMEKERDILSGMNQNLLRINKERSNSSRNLPKKKEHTGYVVLQSREKMFYVRHNKYRIWETMLQSPYTMDITDEQARYQIKKDLTPEGEYWILGSIGIDGYWVTDLDTIMRDEEHGQGNTIFQMQQNANYRSGYWEVIYLHTKALGIIPKNMRY
ncbi:MAG: hypothetical protein Q4B70_15065 [Lachnospiraceae bacterium]|nr:hypothetical protein [Lachnospiraceae bacterium]